MNNARRVTRKYFYDHGSFANSRLYRKANSRGGWMYFEIVE